MPRRLKEARQAKNLKVIEAAAILNVSQPTLSAWERGQKSPNIQNLERMADLYSVTTDFLLGRLDEIQIRATNFVSEDMLPMFHEKPVFSPTHGWLLVNLKKNCLLRFDGSTLPISDIKTLYITPPPCSEGPFLNQSLLSRNDVINQHEVWLEPISTDTDLKNELRGYYRVKDGFVENDCGNRFFLDTYGSKWLAFDKEKEMR